MKQVALLCPAFQERKSWIFDLDHTLYSPEKGLIHQIDQRMTDYMADRLKIEKAKADLLRHDYWVRYGTTLTGLIHHHADRIDPYEFLQETHDIDLSKVSPDPGLLDVLSQLPGQRIIHTNASRGYAVRLVECLGLSGLFQAIYAIEDMNFIGKPSPDAYRILLAREKIDPCRSVFFDDTPSNLAVPRMMGMKVVLIHNPESIEEVSDKSLEPPDTRSLKEFLRQEVLA